MEFTTGSPINSEWKLRQRERLLSAATNLKNDVQLQHYVLYRDHVVHWEGNSYVWLYAVIWVF